MSTKFASNRKRVTLNRKSSFASDEENDVKVVETNDYTRQLAESALSHTTPLFISALNNKKAAAPPTIVSDISPQKQSSRLHLLLEKNMSVGDKSLHTLTPLPTLKPSLRSPNSAPCSPVSKSVHFDNNLENICLFRKAQTPSTIRRGSVFWDKNDDEKYSSTSSDDESDQDSDYDNEEEEEQRQLIYANWPNRLADILNKKDRTIRVEKTSIRLNDSSLVGRVMVRNLDYHKTVMIRYTFDFWETIDNVQAIYRESTNKKVYDVFGFSIDHVPDKPNVVVYFAVYYKVGGQEYWDNNDGKNYEIQIVTSKPTTTNKPLLKTTTNSPTVSVTASTGNHTVIDTSLLSEPPLMTAHKKEDGLSARYSFGQSIHQAKKPPTASFTIAEHQPLHHHHHHHHSHQNTSAKPVAILHKSLSSPSLSTLPDNTTTPAVAMPIPRRKSANGRDPFPLFSSSPTSCHSPLASSPNSVMDLDSQSYMDLVNKYCFYSTSPSRSPMSING